MPGSIVRFSGFIYIELDSVYGSVTNQVAIGSMSSEECRTYAGVQSSNHIVMLGDLWVRLELHTSDWDVVLLRKCQPLTTNLSVCIGVVYKLSEGKAQMRRSILTNHH